MLRRAARLLHLWLGLITGLVLTIVCATGVLLTFREESAVWLHPELTTVSPAGQRLSLDALVEASGLKAPSVTLHADPARSVELAAKKGDTLYMNPYTGERLGNLVFMDTAMGKVFALHRWLLLDDPGKMIVGVSTMIFMFIILTGYIIWWPKNRRALRARLTITRGKGALRLLRDLHSSLGFYVGAILFILALSALPWSFKWADEAVYKLTGSAREPREPARVAAIAGSAPLELLVERAGAAVGPWSVMRLSLPKEPGQPASAQLLASAAPHDKAWSRVELDPTTGAVISHTPFAERPAGARARAHLYAIHVGSVLGWPTRLLALLATALGATFPLTGLLIWLLPKLRRRETLE